MVLLPKLMSYLLFLYTKGVEQLMITSGPAYPQQNMYGQQPNMGMQGGMPPQGMPPQGMPNMGMQPGMGQPGMGQPGFY